MSDSDLNTLLLGLAEQLTTVRTEMSQFPITYYFQEDEAKTALAPCLLYLAELANDICATRSLAAAVALGGTVDDLLETIEKSDLGKEHADRWSAIDALLFDHGREPLRRCHKMPRVA